MRADSNELKTLNTSEREVPRMARMSYKQMGRGSASCYGGGAKESAQLSFRLSHVTSTQTQTHTHFPATKMSQGTIGERGRQQLESSTWHTKVSSHGPPHHPLIRRECAHKRGRGETVFSISSLVHKEKQCLFTWRRTGDRSPTVTCIPCTQRYEHRMSRGTH